jgi:hypothetical protein
MTDKLETIKEALNQAWYVLDGQSDDIKPSNKEITQTSIKVQKALAELNSHIEARDSEAVYTEKEILAWFKEDVDSYNRPYKLMTKVKYLLQFTPKAAIKAMEGNDND